MRDAGRMQGAVRNAMAAALLIGLAACGGGDGGSPPPTGGGGGPAPSPTPPPPPPPFSDIVFAGITTGLARSLLAADSLRQGEELLATGFEGGISNVQISPDGNFAAFSAAEQSGGNRSLYVLSLAGGAPIKVSDETPIQAFGRFEWTPDSTRLVYAGSFGLPSLPQASNVYVVDRDGQNRRGLSGSLGNPPVVSVSGPQVSPDGRYVLTETREVVAGEVGTNIIGYNLYDLEQRTGIILQRNIGGTVGGAEWAPDSTKVCFTSRESGGQFSLLFRNVSDPDSTPSLITSNADVLATCRWDSSADRVAFLERGGPFRHSLLKVKSLVSGSEVTVADFSAEGQWISDFEYRPGDDGRVAFVGRLSLDNGPGLFIGRTDGSGWQQISPVTPNGAATITFSWSPDGNYLAYFADPDNDRAFELIRYRLSDGMTDVFDIPGYGFVITTSDRGYVWAPDSARLAFRVIPLPETTGNYRLYSVDPFSNEPRLISSDSISAVGSIALRSRRN